jgi:hypothetical protein
VVGEADQHESRIRRLMLCIDYSLGCVDVDAMQVEQDIRCLPR